MADTAVERRPGRPRTQTLDERVLEGVSALLESGETLSVRRVVEASGVSKAAIYRRWPGITELIAAALDRGRTPYGISLSGDLLENLLEAFSSDGAEVGYSEERLRTRLRLSLADRDLQQTYWNSHITRRRAGLLELLQLGVARGELRADLDFDACCDLITGVFYYQVVVRGDSLSDPATRDRCRAALRVAWRGMLNPG
ncbi:TetR/AcrR family transcriptional regulator [Leucobacter viscericola]|uniref:TetR/AcrR family transcriptional regulator n=1 Tax=Leucobacter viscericola TaxID=2714935 RepID=A0A6G7XDM4_9MICO|nr:TetR/AcrR family transcriptional regulator [Leucobacter viscericola]QIK62694.1 TetR/AcrR family transcriptional regulator [Leucobacter viscericola]